MYNDFFFHVGEQKIDGAKSGEYGGWSTILKPQSVSHAQQPLQPQTRVQELCPGETGLILSVFQPVHKCV